MWFPVTHCLAGGLWKQPRLLSRLRPNRDPEPQSAHSCPDNCHKHTARNMHWWRVTRYHSAGASTQQVGTARSTLSLA